MPSEHIEHKHKAQSVSRRSDLLAAISEANLDEVDQKILTLHYVQGKPFGYIADTLGYSERQIVRRHKTALTKIIAILAMQ